MEALCFHSFVPQFQNSLTNLHFHRFNSRIPLHFPSNSNPDFTVNCTEKSAGELPLSTSSAYAVLGVDPNCSAAELKSAFRAKKHKNQALLSPLFSRFTNCFSDVVLKVKQFHPDVNGGNSDAMIRRVIQAYEMLSCCSRAEIIERECLDPFDNPECEALDIFVNQVLCAGTGCPYSCVERAPQAFAYDPSTGTARAKSQGHGEDYGVQLSVGQCPRSCIHYVTPSQRVILEELLDSILDVAYDCSAEADLLYSLIVKARFENNQHQKPKKQPKTSTEHVDLF